MLDCVVDQHDTRLVLLAGIVCLLASYTAFGLADRARAERGSTRLVWIAPAAIVTGTGVWATHFIAMLAYAAGMPVGYELGLTALSVAIAVAMSGAGLLMAVGGSLPGLGGAVVGLGIGAMHYTGMAALDVPAAKLWDHTAVAASLLIGIAGGTVALLVGQRDARARPVAAVLLALTICGMHFTGMSAFSLVADPRIALPEQMMAPDRLAVAVAAATLLIVGFGLLGTMVDERLARRSAEEAERLRRYVVELEATRRSLEATSTELQRALAAAAASSQAKSQFLATMSHELRTPLNAVIGFGELMTGRIYGPLGDPRYQDYAETIVESGRRLLALINDILDFTRIDAGQIDLDEAEVDVARLVADGLRVIARHAEDACVEVTADVPDGLPALPADGRRLRQVLLNLLSNAVKFTPEGGIVRVIARARPDGMTLTVTDSGIGIAPEDIPRALDSFGQVEGELNRRYDGTGLGLPLAKRLVELHGGTLSIESAVGVGTTVTVALPRERARSRGAVA